MKGKRRAILIVAVLLVMVILYVCRDISHYRNGYLTKISNALKLPPYEILQAEKEMYPDGQQIQVDDYTVILDKLIWNRAENHGWLKFAITREGADIRKEMPDEQLRKAYNQLQFRIGVNFKVVKRGFGLVEGEEQERFGLLEATEWTPSHTEGRRMWHVMKEDILYYYIYITIDKKNNYCLYLYDRTTGRGDFGTSWGSDLMEDMSGVFELYERDTDKRRCTYSDKSGEYEVIVSPSTVNIRGNGKLDLSELTICYRDGKNYPLVSDGEICEGVNDYGKYVPGVYGIKTYTQIIGLTEEQNFEEIDSIVINGKKCDLQN